LSEGIVEFQKKAGNKSYVSVVPFAEGGARRDRHVHHQRGHHTGTGGR